MEIKNLKDCDNDNSLKYKKGYRYRKIKKIVDIIDSEGKKRTIERIIETDFKYKE